MSTQVAIKKFSFPFSCTTRLSRKENEDEEPNLVGRIEVKALSIPDPQQNRPVVKQKHHEIIEMGPGLPPEGDLEEVPVCSEPPGISGSQKLSTDSEDQRPAAKRQLSSESVARTVTAVKKSAVRKEAEDRPKLGTCLGQGLRSGAATVAGKKRRRRDLFPDAEVFRSVDLHVIQAGAQVRKGCKVPT